ncbi:MAG: hypothetical protein ACTSQH_08390 [Candidatus Hodarchaeales archaeon]
MSKKAIYYIMKLFPRYMIGLESKEWDVIMGGLEAFELAEWKAIDKGCECIDECDPLIVNKGCFDETQIKIIQRLMQKIHVIHKTMEYFEKELRK